MIVGLDWEAGHDPAPLAWKASTLPAYATRSCLWSGRHDSNVHELWESSTVLEAVAAADFATPGVLMNWSRRRESNRHPLTYLVSAVVTAEL
jgi:hypothetical protein